MLEFSGGLFDFGDNRVFEVGHGKVGIESNA